MQRKNQKGFTLIEILIVVAIIAILASVVLVGLGPTQRAGRDARRLSDLREVQTGLELYYNKCGYYPGSAEASSPCDAFSQIGSDAWDGLTTSLTGSSIGVSTVPQDPTAGHTYFYGTTSDGTGYIVAAVLEDPSNSAFTNYTAPDASKYSVSGSSKSTATFSSCDAPTYCLTL